MPPPCSKKAYVSQFEANKALLRIWKHWNKHPERRERNAYRCDRCDLYHLTSVPAGEFRIGSNISS